MSPLSIVSPPGAILSVPRRGPFDGSDWPADPVETSRRTARRCTTMERTTGRRKEIKGGPLGGSLGPRRVSKRGMQEVEEPSGRTTGGQPRPLRTWSIFYPSGAPLRALDRGSVESSICVSLLLSVPTHSCGLPLIRDSWTRKDTVSKFQS